MTPSLKSILRRIPFIKLFIPVILGVLFPIHQHYDFSFLLYTNILLFGITITMFFLDIKPLFFGIFLYLFLFTLVNFIIEIKNNAFDTLPLNEQIQFSGIIQKKPIEKKKSYQSELSITHILADTNWIKCNSKSIVYFGKDEIVSSVLPGEHIIGKSWFSSIENSENSTFNYKGFLEQKHIYTSTYLPENNWRKITREKEINKLNPIKIKEYFYNLLERQQYTESQLAFLSAILFGDKTMLSSTTKEHFARAGIMHIMAVSGLHVGIIAILASIVLHFFTFNQTLYLIRSFIIVMVIWLFAYITGFSPSVNRAAIMFTFLMIGIHSGRLYNAINILFASAFFTLLLNPTDVFSAGFQLSYMAVLGILLIYPHISKLYRHFHFSIKYFIDIIVISIAAQLFTLPISLYYFGSLPVYSLISNLFGVPGIFLVLYISVISLFLYPVSESISVLLANANKFLIDTIITLTETISGLKLASLSIQFSTTQVLVCYIVLFSSLIAFNKIKSRKQMQLKYNFKLNSQ